MRRHVFAAAVLALTAAVSLVSPAAAETTYEFTYASTTDPAYDGRVHLLNTGAFLNAGEMITLQGSGTIQFGGGYSVMTNYDMGLISPLDVQELMRDYGPGSVPLHFEPLPLDGEAVLFGQDRAFMDDDHDLGISRVAQTAGFLYIGVPDEYFQDNLGSHFFTLTVVPEPASIALWGLLGLALHRRRRVRTNRR